MVLDFQLWLCTILSDNKWNPGIFKTLVVDDGGTRPPATTTVMHPHTTTTTTRPDTPPPAPVRTRILFPETWLWSKKTTGYVLFKGCTDKTIFNQLHTLPPKTNKQTNEEHWLKGTLCVLIFIHITFTSHFILLFLSLSLNTDRLDVIAWFVGSSCGKPAWASFILKR